MTASARDRLALALDLSLPQAEELYRAVSSYVGYAKIGLSLFTEHGPAAVHPFLELGAKVFLDLKLHDIPNTVYLASRQIAQLGVSLFTVHAQGGTAMIRAAVDGGAEGAAASRQPRPKILAVTVLTSLSDLDLPALGHAVSAAQLAAQLGRLALAAGADGVVCSPQEVKALRELLGPTAFLCTPGVRLEGAAQGDQSRVGTPEAAIRSGADLLVVGRPIHAAADPAEAARRIAGSVSAA